MEGGLLAGAIQADLGDNAGFGLDFLGGLDGKESACNAGDLGSILGSGRSPGEGNSNPLQYSFLENSTDRGAWWATVHRVTKSGAQPKEVSRHACKDLIIAQGTLLNTL